MHYTTAPDEPCGGGKDGLAVAEEQCSVSVDENGCTIQSCAAGGIFLDDAADGEEDVKFVRYASEYVELRGGQRDGTVVVLREPFPAARFLSPYCGIEGVAPGICGEKAFWEDDEVSAVGGGFGSVCCNSFDAISRLEQAGAVCTAATLTAWVRILLRGKKVNSRFARLRHLKESNYSIKANLLPDVLTSASVSARSPS